jgi:hypothetical protein
MASEQRTPALSGNELNTIPQWLTSLIEAELGGGCTLPLARALAQRGEYDRLVALKLIEAARGLSGEGWPERRLSVMLLENQLLHLPPDDLLEFDFIFVQLGLKPRTGADVPLPASLLKEGYSTVTLKEFAAEFRYRLGRLNRVHVRIKANEWDQEAWYYLIRTSREVCKLTLARYLFAPAEIAEEIQRTAIVTKGVKHTLARVHGLAEFECAGDASDASAFEREILDRLCMDHKIYWVSEQTDSELNSLVEYPLTSAVLVVKPPGSDREFEFKRAGTRGPRKLNIIYERDGKHAPVSHRLHGGSLGWLGRRESGGSALFSKIYRLVHGKECPCSRTVAVSSIVGVPTNQGEQHILDYFTDREAFGSGFDEMRHALQECVKAFPADTAVSPASFADEKGHTLQFIGQAQPQQAIIFDSSSFRLDRIAVYLSDAGPEEYFRTGLGRDYRRQDAAWLADTVLEEILGSVVCPAEGYSTYGQYVRSAFGIPENRRRADAAYLSLMGQIGECWGTLLAVRGYSDGESFVLRNVGLKSRWKDGDWQVRIIFMDHDDLAIAGKRFQHFWPLRAVPGMMRDQVHILGGPLSGSIVPGEIGTLAKIYRVSSELAETGLKTLQEVMKAAYRKTQSELITNEELRDLFFSAFIERLGDLDKLITGFLQTDPSQQESWKSEAAAYLKAKDYPEPLAADYTQAISQFRRFFERTAFLYSPR